MAKKKMVIKFQTPPSRRLQAASGEFEPELITEWNYKRIAGAVVVALFIIGGLSYVIFSNDDATMPARFETEVAATLPASVEQDSPVVGETPSRDVPASPAEVVSARDVPAELRIPSTEVDVEEPGGAAEQSRPAVGGARGVAGETVSRTSSTASPPTSEAVSGAAAAEEKPSGRLAKGVRRASLSRGIWKNEPFGKVVSPVRAKADEAVGLFFFTELEGMRGKVVFHRWRREGKVVFQKRMRVKTDSVRVYTSKLLNTRMLGSWRVELADDHGRILHAESFELIGPGG